MGTLKIEVKRMMEVAGKGTVAVIEPTKNYLSIGSIIEIDGDKYEIRGIEGFSNMSGFKAGAYVLKRKKPPTRTVKE